MSKLFKGIGKAVKGIFKGIGKIFKKITSSTLGKIILAAVVIWTAGAAFGLDGFATNTGIDNIFAGVTEVAATDIPVGVAVAPEIAATGLPAATVTSAVTPAVTEAVTPALVDAPLGVAAELTPAAVTPALVDAPLGVAAELTPAAAAPVELAAAETTAMTPLEASGLSADSGWLQAELAASQASTSGGFLGGIGGKIAGAGRWMQAHPIPSLMGMGFLQGAFSPDQEDLLERQEELRRERYGSLASVGNVNIGFKPPNRPGVLRSKATGAPVYKGGGILSRLRERSSIYSGGTQNA